MQPDAPTPPREPDGFDQLTRYARQPVLIMTILVGGYLGYTVFTSGTGGLGWLWALMGIGWGVLFWFAIGAARRDIAKQDRAAAEQAVDAGDEQAGDTAGEIGGSAGESGGSDAEA